MSLVRTEAETISQYKPKFWLPQEVLQRASQSRVWGTCGSAVLGQSGSSTDCSALTFQIISCPHFKCVRFWTWWENPAFSNSCSLCFLTGRKRRNHLKCTLDNSPQQKLASPWFSTPYFRSGWRATPNVDLGTGNIATRARCLTDKRGCSCCPQTLVLCRAHQTCRFVTGAGSR